MQTKAGNLFVVVLIFSILLFPMFETTAGQESLSVSVSLDKKIAVHSDLVEVTVSLLGYSSNNIGVIEACIPIDTSLFSVVEESIQNHVETEAGKPIITMGYRKGSSEVYYSYVDVVNLVEKGGEVFSFQLEVVGDDVDVLKEIEFSTVILADKDFNNLELSLKTAFIYITDYNINAEEGLLSRIHKNTKVREFKESLSELNVEILDKNDNPVDDEKYVGTGMKVRFELNGDMNEYLLCVTGDANGDGVLNVTDLITVRAHILNKKKLEGIYFMAADVNNNGEINITDYIGINADILNKKYIVPN
ncbi:MAG: hypothetical protein GX166_02870 [Clostridiaceae bacterium]|nr:hypothetical protein [Clostridiaceae bacterium]